MTTDSRAEWHGKVVVVTGAGAGIGAATAALFAECGAAVVLLDVERASAERTSARFRSVDREPLCLQADVSSEKSMKAAAREVGDAFGVVDVLINNAGVMLRRARLQDWTVNEFRRVVDVNLVGTFNVCKALSGLLVGSEGSAVVNISSLSALVPLPQSPAYSAAKAGILGLTRSLASLLAAQGIRVNALLPARVDTAMTRDAPALPAGEHSLRPDEIARAVSDVAARRVSGEIFAVMGEQEGSFRLMTVEDPRRSPC